MLLKKKKKGKLYFTPFNYWVYLNSSFIYKTKQCTPLCIENMQLALSSNFLAKLIKRFCQFQVIILKIYHYILIYHKNMSFFLFGFNIKLDGGRRFAYFNT